MERVDTCYVRLGGRSSCGPFFFSMILCISVRLYGRGMMSNLYLLLLQDGYIAKFPNISKLLVALL